jgi:hypothetical protein
MVTDDATAEGDLPLGTALAPKPPRRLTHWEILQDLAVALPAFPECSIATSRTKHSAAYRISELAVLPAC